MHEAADCDTWHDREDGVSEVREVTAGQREALALLEVADPPARVSGYG